ncbi:class I glutamine amidotransferase-like protein [Xylona heveae TC161]|uniref:Class I glutamine amidotransferase-like protein n=1 Tax=Xylona heveae (strain CBS 132557 / TC161) TaxID=1328760 RepID=A0A165ABY4_XYLHT|nr:class I glutamine amidotransferase-like protein [Xylona heveae TC161]KZF20231.1 class I glutamine amidotransferase-like protein [Xylona heveae TC161]
MILFPGFQPLDVFGPLDAFNILSLSHTMNLYMIASTLDPVSTQARHPSMNPAGSNFYQRVVPTHTFDNAPSDIDVLLIPGGIGTRAPDLGPVIEFIHNRYPSLQYLVTVCTGAALAVRSGVLQGKRATTNKLNWSLVTSLKPDPGYAPLSNSGTSGSTITWIPQARWIRDGNIWTTAGVTAGIDAILAFIQDVYSPKDADRVATELEFDWHQDWQWDPFGALIEQGK